MCATGSNLEALGRSKVSYRPNARNCSLMLPAIEVDRATSQQASTSAPKTDYQTPNGQGSLKTAGSAPAMQTIASSSGNLHLYDNFLARLQGSPSWPDEKEATILEPFTYISASPGKDMRSQLIDAFNIWLRVPLESLNIIKQVVAELHNASLLMDDVEDDSSLRRGMPVAHKIYGIPQTINTANYIYFKAYQRLGSLQSHALGGLSLTDIVNEELLNLHRGQGMDLYWRDSLTCPTEEEYIDMVSNKTGGLFRIAIRLMAATSSQPDKESYVPLVNLIGIIFQIADDYLNLQSDAYKQNKGYCEDLTEGKFSFPIVHSIRADTGNQRLLNVLRQRPTNIELKTYAVTYMDSHTDSFGYTRQVLERLDEQARAEVERLGGNPGLTKFLDRMKAIRLTQPPKDTVVLSAEK